MLQGSIGLLTSTSSVWHYTTRRHRHVLPLARSCESSVCQHRLLISPHPWVCSEPLTAFWQDVQTESIVRTTGFLPKCAHRLPAKPAQDAGSPLRNRSWGSLRAGSQATQPEDMYTKYTTYVHNRSGRYELIWQTLRASLCPSTGRCFSTCRGRW
jgi:hypothetical protein